MQTKWRVAILVGGVALVWAMVALVLLRVMPPPLKNTDFLVIGVVATLAAMGALFVALLSTPASPDSKERPENSE